MKKIFLGLVSKPKIEKFSSNIDVRDRIGEILILVLRLKEMLLVRLSVTKKTPGAFVSPAALETCVNLSTLGDCINPAALSLFYFSPKYIDRYPL